MAKIGLVPIMSWKDPSVTDDDDLGIPQWTAQTAVPIPTLNTDTRGRPMPRFSVVMKTLSETGHTREEAVEKLRREISYRTGEVPELQFSEIEC